jgi:hypothetical protein
MSNYKALQLVNGRYQQVQNGDGLIVGNQIRSSAAADPKPLDIAVPDTTTAATAGGDLTLTAGAGNTSGDGGSININGGAPGASGTYGGSITLTAASGLGSNCAGGQIEITAGDGTGPNDGAEVAIKAGSGLGSSQGGAASLAGGDSATVNGGPAAVQGGEGFTVGGRGWISGGGVSSTTGRGGDAVVKGGLAGSAAGHTGNVPDAGAVRLVGGLSPNDWGGDVFIDGGVGDGQHGRVNIGTSPTGGGEFDDATSAINIGHSSLVTTVTGGLTQLTGAFSLTGSGSTCQISTTGQILTITAGAGSTWSTSAGALTLTSNQAATWSTANGALTVQAATALNLGTTTTTSVSIGRTGQTTTVNGNTQIGAATNGTDTLNVLPQYLHFGNGADHTIDIVQVAAGAGKNLTISSGNGASGSAGGNIRIVPGRGASAGNPYGYVDIDAGNTGDGGQSEVRICNTAGSGNVRLGRSTSLVYFGAYGAESRIATNLTFEGTAGPTTDYTIGIEANDVGGALTVKSADGGAGNTASGALTLKSGDGGGGGNNNTGNVTLDVGVPTGTGTLGTISIGHAAVQTHIYGTTIIDALQLANLELTNSAGVHYMRIATGNAASSLEVYSADTTAAAASGALTLRSGNAVGGVSGNVTVASGTSSTGDTGDVTVGSAASTAGSSGDVTLASGDGFALGGSVSILGGAGTNGSAGGGSIILQAGVGIGAGDGGDITIRAAKSVTGASGDVDITAGNTPGSNGGIIKIGVAQGLSGYRTKEIQVGQTANCKATVNCILYAEGGIDRASAAILDLGVTAANRVNISRTGITTYVQGHLDVAGNTTLHGNLDVVGTSEFQDDVIFDNNVGVGDSEAPEPDMLYFVARETGTFTAVAAVSTGSITAAADLGGSIIAVANNGGNAEFQTGAAHNLSAGMVVAHAGCAESTYNGTFAVGSVTAADKYTITSGGLPVAYVANDTGTWKGLTRFTTAARSPDPLSVGSWVEISGTTDYDGFRQVVAVSDNTHFDLNRVFTSTKTGTWYAGPIRVTSSTHTMNAGTVVTLDSGGYSYSGAWTISNVSDNTHFDIATDWVGTQSGTWLAADSGGRFGGNGGSYPTEVLMPRDVNHTFRVAESPSGTPGGNLSIRAGDSPTGGGNLYLDAGGEGINSGEIYIGSVRSRLINISVRTSVFGAAVPYLEFASSNITIQPGITLTTTGSGNINLPNNGSAQFKIEGTSVGATVTAANLDTLTDGSTNVTLHTHAAASATQIVVTVVAGEVFTAGSLVSVQNNAGVANGYKSNVATYTAKANVVGIAASATQIIVSGEATVVDAWWESVPAVADVGKPVYASEITAGKLTMTAPNTSGNVVQKVGVISFASASANLTRVVVQIGDNTTL